MSDLGCIFRAMSEKDLTPEEQAEIDAMVDKDVDAMLKQIPREIRL